MSSKLSENLTSKSESWQLFEDKMLKERCIWFSRSGKCRKYEHLPWIGKWPTRGFFSTQSRTIILIDGISNFQNSKWEKLGTAPFQSKTIYFQNEKWLFLRFDSDLTKWSFWFQRKTFMPHTKKSLNFFLPLKVWQYRILLISFPFHWTSYLHLVLQKSLRDILWFPCSRFRKCPKMSSTQRSVQKEDNFYKIVVKRLNTYNTLNFSVVEIVYLLVQFLHRTKDSCKQVYWNRNRCIGS